VTNTGATTGSVNGERGEQADGAGSGFPTGGGMAAGGGVPGDGSGLPAAPARAEAGPADVTGPQAARGTAATPALQPAGSPGSAHAARARRSASGSRFALANWRVRWRLAAVIAVPTAIAAILGGSLIYTDVGNLAAANRVQHLAQLNASVVRFTQALEDERDLSAGYAANRAAAATSGLAAQLSGVKSAATQAAASVTSQAAGVTTGAGYQPGTVQNLDALLAAIADLPFIRQNVTSSSFPASQVVRAYTDNVIEVANTFSASVGNGANDADLESNVTALGALLRAEDETSEQRAILFAALSAPQGTLLPEDLTNLQQAGQQESADESDFDASTTETEQQNFSNTVSGAKVDLAASQETLAESLAASNPSTPLTRNASLAATSWYSNMSATIDDTRTVADGLNSAITSRAATLHSRATQDLLVISLVTLVLLLLVVLISSLVARSLIRPLRKLRADALDVAGNRLPEMVRRLSQSEGADAGVEIEPIGVTSTDEIGEVARAFDQVHREAVRLAADEAMLRGNLNAMFINLSRRSQSLIERQLSLIDSLEQSEQDPGRLASLFRLDHLATRMRRNSENLLVLAGHEVTRRWSQPVALVDVLRAAISEIEQYERVVLNVQPGIVVVGQAVNDVVHLVAEIVENATTFSPEDSQVYVSGQPLSSGGVLLDITDNGVGISDQEMAHANWRLDNPPVVDVAVSRRMGLFVVGRLAARHGVRVRLRHAQAGGLTALIWLPDTVAAPEIVPPLGRLRRFEPDDYGPAPSLSAPTQTSGAAAQAMSASRIPRFSPTTPGVPPGMTPPGGTPRSRPAVTPAASQGPGSPATPASQGPPQGPSFTPAGTGQSPTGSEPAPAGAVWESLGGPIQPPPTRNGNGTVDAPAQGGQGTQAPWGVQGPGDGAEIGPGGPSRMPSFGGPSAGQPTGMPGGYGVPAEPGNGSAGTDGQSVDPGIVAIPPAAAQDQRLPIFDSLESDWFRRSGKTLSATRTVPQGQAAQADWTSPADEGWRAAEVVASPATGETTSAGLPKRVPRANLVPGSIGSGGQDAETTGTPARSADAVRSRMASFQRGVREGRAAAPQTEESSDL
jgi:signal transduction histidine kinase